MKGQGGTAWDFINDLWSMQHIAQEGRPFGHIPLNLSCLLIAIFGEGSAIIHVMPSKILTVCQGDGGRG